VVGIGRPAFVALVPLVVLLSCARASGPGGSVAGQPVAPDYGTFDRRFVEDVQPVLSSYCHGCHGGEQPRSMLDLTRYETTAQIVGALRTWEHVRNRLDAEEMPPEGMPQPTAVERQRVIDWIDALGDYEARRSAGDPGIVLAHRCGYPARS
jgi:hypothetical protein